MELTVDMPVRIIGGPWTGHRGVVMALVEGVPSVLLVSVGRSGGPSRPSWDTQPVPMMVTYYVMRKHIAPYREA
jgi:hypothetical protein